MVAIILSIYGKRWFSVLRQQNFCPRQRSTTNSFDSFLTSNYSAKNGVLNVNCIGDTFSSSQECLIVKKWIVRIIKSKLTTVRHISYTFHSFSLFHTNILQLKFQIFNAKSNTGIKIQSMQLFHYP